MTDRERLVRQLHYESTDRCFNMEFGYWDENYTVWSMFRENGIKTEGQANEFLGFDRLEGVGGNIWMSPGFESKTLYETPERRVIIDGNGLTAEIKKDGGSSIPHYLSSSVVTPDDWLKVKRERFARGGADRRVDVAGLLERHPNDRDYPLYVDCGSMIGRIRDMLTLEGLVYACCDYPEMVEDMVETCCLLAEDFLAQVLPYMSFDLAGGWEDICCKNGPLVSVPFFRDVVAPRYARIQKMLGEYGIDVWYTDCDGDVRPILPFFIENGVNCLFPFEVNSCSHPSELFERYGRELRIMGGFDKMKLGGGRRSIDEYLESIVPCVKRGGYIPFCDHRCPPNVTQEDYLYYLDRKEELFGMN